MTLLEVFFTAFGVILGGTLVLGAVALFNWFAIDVVLKDKAEDLCDLAGGVIVFMLDLAAIITFIYWLVK